MVGMLRSFIVTICTFISNLFHAVWTVLEPDPPAQALSLLDFMEKLSRRQLAVKQLKEQFMAALQTNNTEEVLRILHTGKLDIDTVLEVDDPSMVLASYKQGYWLPGYKLETSWAMGIHVCVMYNAVETALVLLEKGAAVNQMPNGKTPLHVACEVSNSDCVALLLAHGAKVNSLSLSGHTPLHYCITSESVNCAKHLIYKGAQVNMASRNNEEDTPLHTAARFGVPELVALYLKHGASVDAINSLQETPLMTAVFWAFDAKEQTYSQEHHFVCRLLLDQGADPNLKEEDHKTALHKAAWNCDHILMEMLLEAGADTRAMDINGCAPIQYLLKVTDIRPMAIPELCYQLLLNYNAARVYPPQFHKVLQSCYNFPGVIEIMVNSYKRLKPTRKWRASIPDDCYERHKDFYDSLFAVCSNTPRSLLHLSRCAIRASLDGFCHRGVTQLPLPFSMKKYLLLEPEGILY
ncbi:ankyrin repeat and SOCS box protein 4 isoform X1 [Parambassis ranga]|uniref:Ankyrin repeat and SOCS box protein 4 isoform X1 n=2 Tax=Parambassis ranga TaxID=210632 RepID=A0A6P7K874_9TELE|nr:ankyrin repeat and SOCS box protein 4 isoform X1 [Parambassis ranga]XP_028284786.1 ankyrin repeat and SOCS box protein 4 isoform X1 [Parambassis ranga]